MGGRFALLIATYTYEDAGLRQLTAPGNDAEALAEVLGDPAVAGFEVTTLVNEPHHRVGAAVGDFLRARAYDDLTLLYFTGHGLKDDDGRLHLATVNTRLANRMFTSVPAEQIDQAMSACMSRQQVLILDCCYSGAFPAGRLAKGDPDVHTLERFQGHGRTVLTASDAAQAAFEEDRLHGNASRSVFTKHLVQGLRDGSADLNGDGDITLDELYTYVHDKVVAEMPKQRPKKQENIEGRTVIAQNANWTLPAQLRNALRSPLATERLGGVEQLARLYRIGNARVRAQAAEQLRLLTDDDSRAVSAAAAAVGEAAGQPPTAAPRPADIQNLIDQATEERDAGARERAEERYWSALDLAIQHHARRQEGWAWDGLGACRWRAGDFEMALKFFTRADRIADETGDALLKAWSLYNFGMDRREHRDFPAAKDFFKRSLAVADVHRCHTAAGWTHHQMAELAHEEGNARQKREHYEAAVQNGLAGHNHSLTGWSLFHVAICAEQAGDLAQASEHYGRTLEIGSRSHQKWMVQEAEKALTRITDAADHATDHGTAGS
ncbi:caspase, EACC1-associated type [Streptomyces shenzhenensis]|uniref:caspase, EACC1-associated type n=1 Tax=Streptomyces shenzhenensis TaxID=943815 RepID=UPI0015F09707|nr:tetratricopeptide repeat protein [Streptomyces shenzhenensis]